MTHLHAVPGSEMDAPCGAISTPDAPLRRGSPGAVDCIACLRAAAGAGAIMQDQLLTHGMRGMVKMAWQRVGAWR